MSRLSEHHRVLTHGVGKCSCPMWHGDGIPAGFCDAPAYGERPPSKQFWSYAHDRYVREDGRYNGYVPALACPAHGGPDAPKPDEPKVLTRICPGCNTVHSGPLCPETKP